MWAPTATQWIVVQVNRLSYSFFLCIFVYFPSNIKKGYLRAKCLRVNEKDDDCYHAKSKERGHLLLLNRIGYVNLKDGKKGNCSQLIMTMEAEEVKTKKQGLDLNALLA